MLSEFCGSIIILAMCSEVFKPIWTHVFPASIDLYIPSPKPTDLWLLFSPVPNHKIFGFFGSMVIVPIE